MKCNICESETPPLYQHQSLAAWICHTCKALGRMIESAFSPDLVQPAQEPASEQEAQIEAPAPVPQVEQIVDQEPTVSTGPKQTAATEADQTDVSTQASARRRRSNDMEERRRGIVRISVNSIIKALYGNVGYEAVGMRVSREDRSMLEITVSHPSLPEWKQGQRLKEIKIERRYQQDDK